jgi:ABC-type transport system involved in multi-copper enzyme maturation permease subunit
VNALTVKELSGVSRRWQVYAGRVVYMGLIALFLLPIILRHDMRVLRNPSEYAAIGKTLFYALLALQMIFVSLMAVSAASDMISKEVRGGTLGLLALTPLTPWRIVLGKWKAAVVYSSSLFLCGVPVLATCAYLGGVGVLELVWSTCLTAAVAALSGALTIFYSSVLRAGYTATIAGVLTLAAYSIMPMFLIAASRGDEGFFILLFWTHPAYSAVGAAMGDVRHGSAFGWIGATIVTVLISGLLLRWAAHHVARKIQTVDRAGNRTDAIVEPTLASGGSPVWDSRAILWKELRTRRSAGLRRATWIGFILLGVFLILSMMGSAALSEKIWQPTFLWYMTAFLLLMAMGSGVSLFVREKEGRQWDVLLSTPLTAWQIILAKATAGVFNLLPLWTIFFAFFTLIALADSLPFLGWMMGLASLTAASALAYLTGAAMSLRSGSIRAAFSATFGLLGLILFFLPLILSFWGAFMRGWEKDEFPFVLVTMTHPGTFLAPLSTAMVASRHSNHDYQKDFIDLLPYFMVYLLFYGSAIVGLFLYMKGRFAAITGRRDGA